MNQKKQNELIVWEYFIPNLEWEEKTDEDITMFFEWSERGKHKELVNKDRTHFNALVQGKRWAGIHAHEMYEPGVLEGSTPYWMLLGGEDEPTPDVVVSWLQKEMFKGIDSDLIEQTHKLIKTSL